MQDLRLILWRCGEIGKRSRLGRKITISFWKTRRKFLNLCINIKFNIYEWTSLELHHINGVKDDLRIDNLQILCPNCHALTDNYRGKNKGMSAQEETLEVEAG